MYNFIKIKNGDILKNIKFLENLNTQLYKVHKK